MEMVNLVLCIVILVLGYWGYKKSSDERPIYIAVAFGLFGISHLAALLGFEEKLEGVFIALRTLAYLIVVFTVYRYWKH
ncbi:MAG: hypothetical protein ACXQT1_05200 [Methermicoccaceae archaeon]